MLVFWKARIVMSVQPPKPGIFLYTQLTLASTDTEIEVPPVLIHLNEIFHYKPSIFGATILGKPLFIVGYILHSTSPLDYFEYMWIDDDCSPARKVRQCFLTNHEIIGIGIYLIKHPHEIDDHKSIS